MAINAADARQLARIMLEAYGEDLQTVALILRPLRVQLPTIDWVGELTTMARAHQPFVASGLSVDWWLLEVDRLSQPSGA